MSGRRAVALGVVAWVAVAAAGAVLVWLVISRAGNGVTGGFEAVAEPAPDRPSSSEPVRGQTVSPSGSPESPDPSRGTGNVDRPVTRTWQGAAGWVSATCTGSTIRRDGATAYSGFTVEPDDSGPVRVRVEFESEESKIRVEAVCVDGVPVFSTDGGD